MIRFIDLRGQGTGARFAFWNTVTMQPFTFLGQAAWDTHAEFISSFEMATGGDQFAQQGFERLMPAWTRLENVHAEEDDAPARAEHSGGVGAEDMHVIRMQSRALAFQWMLARDYRAHEQGYAFILVRAQDLGLRPETLNGLQIRVSLSFEPDAT